MPKNAQTTAQLHSSHTLALVMLKILQARLQQYMNFQMFKLDLEKTEEPEIKLPTSVGSSKKQESSRKASTSASLTMPKPLIVWITANYGNFFKRWEYQTTWLPPKKSVCWSRSNSWNWPWNNRMVPNRESSSSRLYIVILLICRVCHEKCWTGWSISLNQDFQEKYQ